MWYGKNVITQLKTSFLSAYKIINNPLCQVRNLRQVRKSFHSATRYRSFMWIPFFTKKNQYCLFDSCFLFLWNTEKLASSSIKKYWSSSMQAENLFIFSYSIWSFDVMFMHYYVYRWKILYFESYSKTSLGHYYAFPSFATCDDNSNNNISSSYFPNKNLSPWNFLLILLFVGVFLCNKLLLQSF